MNQESRLSCKGLLRESLSSKKDFPTLMTLCINKLRTIRNSITNIEVKNISVDLIYLIFKGSTCHELLNAERNNCGIQNMFGRDDGQLWETLWETAVRIRYSNNEQVLSKKDENESFKEFFIRNQEDAEKKFKSHVLKRSKSIGDTKVKRSSLLENPKLSRRTISLHNIKFSNKTNANSMNNNKNNINTDNNISSIQSPLFKPRNTRINNFNSKPQKSNNPILREYFEQKLKSNNLNKLLSTTDRSSKQSSILSSSILSSSNSSSNSLKNNRKSTVTFKID